MRYHIGFIGCGNMASAMIGGMLDCGICSAEEVIACDRNEAALDAIEQRLGIHTANENIDVTDSKYIVLAVKPFFYRQVIDEIKEKITDAQVIISITPNFSLKQLEEMFGK